MLVPNHVIQSALYERHMHSGTKLTASVFPKQALKIYSRNLHSPPSHQGLPTKANSIPILFSVSRIFFQLTIALPSLMDQLQNTDNYFDPENIHCQNFMQTFIRTCCNQLKRSNSACTSRFVRTALQSQMLLLLNQPCEPAQSTGLYVEA